MCCSRVEQLVVHDLQPAGALAEAHGPQQQQCEAEECLATKSPAAEQQGGTGSMSVDDIGAGHEGVEECSDTQASPLQVGDAVAGAGGAEGAGSISLLEQGTAVARCGTGGVEVGVEGFQQLCRERATLLSDLCSLRAKFELTLETLRSVLRLGADATWADIIERSEMLAQAGGDGTYGNSLAPTLTDAELEREQLEENLEAQTAYNARLRELLQKQQQLLDMTAQLDWKDASERAETLLVERDTLHKQLQQQQDNMVRQERVIREQAQRIASVEAELEHGQELLAAATAEQQRERAEVRELVDALARQEDLVEHLKAQLQVHEAAERRRHSYHPAGRGVAEDVGSEFSSSVGSARTSARGPPSRVGSEQDVSFKIRAQAARPIEEMDKDERDAFLSHFPMASRTERHMRNRLEDRRRRPGAGAVA
mmetsp:Transcript_78048/g.181013  ORF Transcript_78048/g.181013 Transcript_78048/m.181013 type:complete len:426 (-) Transcript_78048:242-1519(-)